MPKRPAPELTSEKRCFSDVLEQRDKVRPKVEKVAWAMTESGVRGRVG